MNKIRGLGVSLIIIGLLIISVKPLLSLTGFAVALETLSTNQRGLNIAGLIFVITGVILALRSAFDYEAREEQLKKMIGPRYNSLSEVERIAANKALRRYSERVDKADKLEETQSEYQGPEIIRTRQFNRAVEGHEREVERAIAKLSKGGGEREQLIFS